MTSTNFHTVAGLREMYASCSLKETTKKYEDQIINTAAIVSYILIAIILKDPAGQTFVEGVNASMTEVEACVCEIDPANATFSSISITRYILKRLIEKHKHCTGDDIFHND